MDEITLLLVIIVLIVLISAKSAISNSIKKLQDEVLMLRDQIKSLQKSFDKKAESNALPLASTTIATTVVVKDENIASIQKPVVPDQLQFNLVHTNIVEITNKEDIKPTIKNTPKIPKSLPQHTAAKPTFFERNPDLEKFIGENLISKIGIAILVLAIGYFVKFAIDNNWIGTVGRVAIGILCGGVLVTFAHFLRKNYAAFSGVLIGGGIAVFYFTIALAFHEYQLFSQPLAFAIMLVITIFAVLLSLLYNRQDTAIISLIGGFAAPFMVSNGSNNYIALFAYLILLNSGLLVIAYRKAWRILNLTAFIFTVLLFAVWIMTLPNDSKKDTYQNGLLFATIFYLLFFAINIANNIKNNKQFLASDFGILLANTALYFGVGLYCLDSMACPQYRGLFSAGMGVFNLAITYLLMRGKKVDKNVLYLLIGITLTFISITAPLQLHGHFITLFWASEMVLLYWLYRKSNIAIIQISSLIISVAMLISLLMDWDQIYLFSNENYVSIIFNKGFMTGIYCAAAIFILKLFYKMPINENKLAKEIQAFMLPILSVIFPVLLYLTGFLEINHQITNRLSGLHLQILYLLLFTLAFSFIYLRMSNWFVDKEKLAIGWICILTAIYLLCLPATINLQQDLLVNKASTMPHFMAHWLSAFLLIGVFYLLVKYMIKQGFHRLLGKDVGTWILAVIIVLFLSCECFMLVNSLFYNLPSNLYKLQTIYIKTLMPILWGACSFSFMWVGMKYKYRTLRIISLSLFSITLIKLFAYDIENISPTGKIAAFFCLGILLLVISFMYQRLKNIIIEDENKTVV